MVNFILNILSVVHSCGDLQLQMFALLWSSGENSRLERKSRSQYMDGSRSMRMSELNQGACFKMYTDKEEK